MAVWESPIYDRTQADVDYAIAQIDMLKQMGNPLNAPLKGCLNLSDISRIETNIEYLSEELSALYYFSHVDVGGWNEKGLPNIEDVNRIIGNIKTIRHKYYPPPLSPELPKTMLRFEDINSIEENLYLLKKMMDNMVASFIESMSTNGYYCGEEVAL